MEKDMSKQREERKIQVIISIIYSFYFSAIIFLGGTKTTEIQEEMIAKFGEGSLIIRDWVMGILVLVGIVYLLYGFLKLYIEEGE